MNTASRIFKSLLIAALLGSVAAQAAEQPIQVAMEDGQPVALFKVGGSRCVLKDDRIRCTPIDK